MVLTSCNKVNPPYTTSGNGSGQNDTVRKVLLEEFTGHQCPNCPNAHTTAKNLKDFYDKQLIIVVVHATSFTDNDNPPFVYNFKTPAGNELFTFFPSGQGG